MWVAHLVENKIKGILDYHHAQKRDRRREQALAHVRSSLASGSVNLEPAADIPLPEGIVADRELAARVEGSLERLSPDQREAILMRSVLDAPFDEIAAALGKSTAGAARRFYVRARATLLTPARHGGGADLQADRAWAPCRDRGGS